MALGLLKKMAVAAPASKPKATGSPILDLGDSFADTLKEWMKGKKEEVAGETKRKQAEEIIRQEVLNKRNEEIVKDGKFYSSVKVKAGDVGPIGFVEQNKYSPIKEPEAEKLKDIFVPGLKDEARDEAFKLYFEMQMGISLSPEGMTAINDLLPKIIAAVGGEEAFMKYFKVETTYKPTEHTHEGRLLNKEIGAKVALATEQGLMKGYQPFFRVA